MKQKERDEHEGFFLIVNINELKPLFYSIRPVVMDKIKSEFPIEGTATANINANY